MRERTHQVDGYENLNNINSPAKKNWPPEEEMGGRYTPRKSRTVLRRLKLEEMERLKKAQTFPIPNADLGDLVEVKYELSRSAQTFATFQGYVTCNHPGRLDHRSLHLQACYDGVGVRMLHKLYSPRMLDMRIVRQAVANSEGYVDGQQAKKTDRRKTTRNHRFHFEKYIRAKCTDGNMKYWWRQATRPGVLSIEQRIRRELSVLGKKNAQTNRDF